MVLLVVWSRETVAFYILLSTQLDFPTLLLLVQILCGYYKYFKFVFVKTQESTNIVSFQNQVTYVHDCLIVFFPTQHT